MVQGTPDAPNAPSLRCDSPRRGIALQHADGRLTPVRCKASNRCRYCSWCTAVENAAMVAIDARDELPNLVGCLTTRAAVTPPAVFRRDIEHTIKAVRRRHPAARYLALTEHTTGRGKNAAGHRRVHAHLLLKGVPTEDAPELRAVLRDVWSSRTGADRVTLEEIRSPGGATAYLVNHHQKTAQAPPAGWSGKRFRPSVAPAYFGAGTAEVRERAKEVVADKRLVHAVGQHLEGLEGYGELDPETADEIFATAVDEARVADPPTIVRVADLPAEFDEGGMPTTWSREVLGPLSEVGW